VKVYDRNGNYAYLPTDLRDFHNQKGLFKELMPYFDNWLEENKASISIQQLKDKNITWVDLHILMTDFLLYQMAQKGYVLRKSSKFKP